MEYKLSQDYTSEIPQAEIPQVHRQTIGRTAIVHANILAGFGIETLEQLTIANRQELESKGIYTYNNDSKLNTASAERLVVKSWRILGENGDAHEILARFSNDPLVTRENLEVDLQNIRQLLAGLDPNQQKILQEYCNLAPLHYLKKAKNKNRVPEGRAPLWQSWLSEEASDEQLVNFLQWHVAKIEEQETKPEVQEAIGTQYQQYKQAVSQSVEQGWLHESAEAAVDEVDGIKAHLGDIFDTHMQQRDGYHIFGIPEIIIAAARRPAFINSSLSELLKNINRVAKHELNHAVLGRLNGRWINEALTEHIAQALDDNEWNVLCPSECINSERRPVYAAERRLLDTVLSHGINTIPVSLATRAYSEREPSIEARAEFDYAVDDAWDCLDLSNGRGALQSLNSYVSDLEKEYQALGSSVMGSGSLASKQTLVDLIEAPELIFENEGQTPLARKEFITNASWPRVPMIQKQPARR